MTNTSQAGTGPWSRILTSGHAQLPSLKLIFAKSAEAFRTIGEAAANSASKPTSCASGKRSSTTSAR